VHEADLGSGQGQRQGMGHVRDRDAVLRRLHLVHADLQSRLRVFDIPVRVHNTCGVFEDGLDLLRNFGLAGEIWAVDLCDESLDDRRPRRHFTDLNASAILVADGIEQRTKPLGDAMALHTAFLGR